MLTFLIIAAIVVGIILYIKFVSYIDYERYKVKFRVVFDAHKEIGYPSLTEKQQFDILDNENMASILKITKHKIVPTGLLNYYLNITPNDYFEHLKAMNLKERMKFDPAFLKDGFYIDIQKNDFAYIFVDRNAIVFRKKFSTYNKLLKYIVYYRLNLYAPRKYKFAWLKKHFA
jgi:hypothetical protein